MGIDIEAQKQYWQTGALSDLEAAEILIEKAVKDRVVTGNQGQH